MSEFEISTIDKGASFEILKDSFSLTNDGIANWLKVKKIIQDSEILVSFKDLMQWTRTGGETYSTTFQFSTDKYTKEILIKAIVTTNPKKSLLDWARRRSILKVNDVPVSNWYHFGDGVIFEDFYPMTYEIVPFYKLLSLAYKLDKLGFSTLKFVDDIRSDKDGNPFYIDFGFDLGEPSGNLHFSAKEYLIKKYPQKIVEIRKFYTQQLS